MARHSTAGHASRLKVSRVTHTLLRNCLLPRESKFDRVLRLFERVSNEPASLVNGPGVRARSRSHGWVSAPRPQREQGRRGPCVRTAPRAAQSLASLSLACGGREARVGVDVLFPGAYVLELGSRF